MAAVIVAGNEDGGPLGVRHTDRFASLSEAQAIRFLKPSLPARRESSKSMPSSDSPLPIGASVPIGSSRTAVLKALFDAYSDGRSAKAVRANSIAHYGRKSNIIQGRSSMECLL